MNTKLNTKQNKKAKLMSLTNPRNAVEIQVMDDGSLKVIESDTIR